LFFVPVEIIANLTILAEGGGERLIAGIAGKEKNVNDFVAMMKKKGKAFGVRARNYDASKNTGEVWIYDKSGKTEQLFETLTIDLNTKQVLNRRGK
jgi:hypothetical protein